jgi:hypothetical protein
VFLLPPQYGGKNQIELRSPSKCEVVQISVPDNTQLETISVPAGKVIVWTYYLIQGQELQCYLRNTQEFTLNIFYSRNKKVDFKNLLFNTILESNKSTKRD